MLKRRFIIGFINMSFCAPHEFSFARSAWAGSYGFKVAGQVVQLKEAFKDVDRGFHSPSFVVQPDKVAMMEMPAVHQGSE